MFSRIGRWPRPTNVRSVVQKFSARNWETLAEALHRHALENDVAAVTKTPFGTCYVIEGTLRSPDGRNPSIRTVWAQDDDEDLPPRLVTAYPISARKGNT